MVQRSTFLGILLFGIIGTGASAQEDSYDLKYKFQVAGPLKYKMIMNSWKSTKMGQYPSIEVQTFNDIDFTAQMDEKQEEGRFPIILTFDNLDVTTRVEGQTNYPSIDILRGKSMTMVISERGKIEKTLGKAMLPLVQLVASDPTTFNFGDIFKEFFYQLPENPVHIGEEWTTTRKDSSTESGATTITEMEGSFEFSKITEKEGYTCGLIKGKMDLKINQKGQAMGSTVSFKGKGKAKTQCYFAIEEGILVYSKLNVTVDGDIEMSGSQKMDGILSQNSEMTYKVNQ
jgi:hypothetical protein